MRYLRILTGRRRKVEAENSCSRTAEKGSGDTGVVRAVKGKPGHKATDRGTSDVVNFRN